MSSYQIIQLCKKCKSAIVINEAVISEYRTKPVYQLVDECEKCENNKG